VSKIGQQERIVKYARRSDELAARNPHHGDPHEAQVKPIE